MTDLSVDETRQITLAETLDRVLNKGAVVAGDVTISVANVDLVYLGLQLVLCSVETARTLGEWRTPLGSHHPETGVA